MKHPQHIILTSLLLVGLGCQLTGRNLEVVRSKRGDGPVVTTTITVKETMKLTESANLGWVEYQKGNFEKAIEELSTSILEFENLPEPQSEEDKRRIEILQFQTYQSGMMIFNILAHQGKEKQAVRQLDKAGTFIDSFELEGISQRDKRLLWIHHWATMAESDGKPQWQKENTHELYLKLIEQ